LCAFFWHEQGSNLHLLCHHKGEEREYRSETHEKRTTTGVQPQIATITTERHTEKRCDFGVSKEEEEAQRLKEQACRKLESADMTFQAAQKAQEDVERAAARANMVTEQAMRQEVAGQKNLVEAGQKMMQAGAKLQEEAATMGRQAEVTHIQKGQINQSVGVNVPHIPAAEMHVLQNKTEMECRPTKVETTVRTEKVEEHKRAVQ